MWQGKSLDQWIDEYEQGHRHPMNRLTHLFGIPLIAISLLLAPMLWLDSGWKWLPAWLFGIGWLLQFVGHAFEGKPPEFFRNWRFLFVGLRWWFRAIAGKA